MSLEYFEDPYLPGLDLDATPSLDEVFEGDEDDDDECSAMHWPMETELYLRSLTLDQLLSVPDEDIENILIDPIHDIDLDGVGDDDDHQRVEAEFVPRTEPERERFRSHLQSLNRIRKIRFMTKKAMRDIKVTFVDLSKPYLVKISSNDNYKKFLNISSPGRCPASRHHCLLLHSLGLLLVVFLYVLSSSVVSIILGRVKSPLCNCSALCAPAPL